MAEEIKQETTTEIPSIALSEATPEERKAKFEAMEAERLAKAKAEFNEKMEKNFTEGISIFQLSDEELEELHCPVIVKVTAKHNSREMDYLSEAGGIAVAQELYIRAVNDPRVVFFSNAINNMAIKNHKKVVEKETETGEKEVVFEDDPIFLKSGVKTIKNIPLVTPYYQFSVKEPGKNLRAKEEHCFSLVHVNDIDLKIFPSEFEKTPEEDFDKFAQQQDKDAFFRAVVKRTGERIAEAKAQGKENIDYWAETCQSVDDIKMDIKEEKNARETALYDYDLEKPYTTAEERIHFTLAREFQIAIDEAESPEKTSKAYAKNAVCKLLGNPKVKFDKNDIEKVMNEFAPGAVRNTGYGKWIIARAEKEMAKTQARKAQKEAKEVAPAR